MAAAGFCRRLGARSGRTLRGLIFALTGLLMAALLLTGSIFWLDRVPAVDTPPPQEVTPVFLERGAVLARAGNCGACHTRPGGQAYAGGRAIATPFGMVYSTNLTPDQMTGLGAWSADDFWRALHHGIGRDGRRLNPAFPYTQFTRITRADSDALFAWLRTLPPVSKPRHPHQLKPFVGTPLALAAWRVLFFRPGPWQDDATQSPEWNRGAYLVYGAGHCVACHGGRNALGGQRTGDLAGGLLPTHAWYAPSLLHASEASVAHWPVDEIVALLRDGVALQGRVSGPMVDVVQQGTQHLPPADLHAIAVFLKSLPVLPAPAHPKPASVDAARLQRGARLYADHCESCHGPSGEGGVTTAGATVVPALAGNRLVTQEPAVNLVRLMALGGFGAETAAHPRPFSMPGFAYTLSDDELADIASFLRNSWGARASSVSSYDVSRWRGDAD